MALMSEPVTSLQDDTRKQLGAFLRARRESLDPQRLGLPRSGRRRTPGLRREEVALLADVGVTWYTWLEQGRDVNPSSAVMAAVAKALQCTPTEARHLFLLAGLPPGEAPQAVCCEGISEGTRRLLDTLGRFARHSETKFRYRGVERQLRSSDGRGFQHHSPGRP